MPKPFSQACENNKHAILELLQRHLGDAREVLEIGSGTGQHAVHFARTLTWLRWQCSDLAPNHAGIQAWLDEARLTNLLPPIELDVARRPWPVASADAVFSANTAHILSWRGVRQLVAGAGELLGSGGRLLVYGPFDYRGAHTSESNARFHAWLRARDPASGIRSFEDMDREARAAGFALREDAAMPANNRLLVWRKT